ncbi:MAG: TonB-dependent receptor [Gemmatimonadales bacterium]|nr:MAG: TonB-dependent receptor [Gemmatimonadales bacterium]
MYLSRLFKLLGLVAVLPLIGMITAAPLAAQEPVTITGTVTDASTGSPLGGVTVSVVGTNRTVQTSSTGSYAIRVLPGSYTLQATSIGYAPGEEAVSVSEGDDRTVNFQLASQAIEMGQVLVAIGSRTARTATQTPVPIDVITAAEIRESGHTEVNQILREIVPSFNASHQNISDGTDHINPASLRGLGPDQVLVLINGKRRHSSSLVNVNGTFGRGTVGTDLNAIPPSAIARIEVLRDGASAQYGSDAIAGVINIVLKEQTESLQASMRGGMTGGCFKQPDHPDGGSLNIDWDCDGEQVNIDANFGFPIGDGGFFNVTGSFLNRERTNRSGLEMKDQFLGISGVAATDAEIASRGLTRADFSMTTGQAEAVVGMAFFNSAVPIGNDAELYAFGGVSRRAGAATGFFRRANEEEKTILELYPNGFLPDINTGINDESLSVGIRGNHSGWDVDLSLTHGGNSLLYNIENTDNASMGAASPVSFDAGTLSFNQNVGNLDAVRLLDTDAFKSLSFVTGAEFRVENYAIEAGDDASWMLGNGGPVAGVDFDTTSTGGPRAAGSQVFPGFQPANEVDRTRNSISAYAGFESEINDQVTLDIGGRFENYTDFGSVFTGKLASRIEVSEGVAVRGAVSTGFRAPSLHQVWFNNISTQFKIDPGTGELVATRVLTANNLSGVATAFGIPALKEETSVNISGGITVNPSSNFSLTADVYHIQIDDRIVLTSTFTDSDPIVADLLLPFASSGVGQAQFFSNAVDTRTTGVDIVATYGMEMNGGQLTLTGSANFSDTEVKSINVPASVADKFTGGDLDAVAATLFNREERNRLEDALPRAKGSVSAKYVKGRFSSTLRGNYFGSVEYKPTNSDNDETFGAKVLVDLDLSHQLSEGVRWSIGANNLFNTYPDQHTFAGNRSDERFVFSRRVTQFGSNGGFYYTKLSFDL